MRSGRVCLTTVVELNVCVALRNVLAGYPGIRMMQSAQRFDQETRSAMTDQLTDGQSLGSVFATPSAGVAASR